jgi:putative ABC transport system permease protein
MDQLWQDIRFGARLLTRFPGVTAAALIALALGTGVNTALFSVVNAVLLQPLPFPDSNALVQLWRTEPPTLQFGSASYTRYHEWRARNRIFEETGAWAPGGLTLTGRGAPERLTAARASASFFTVVGAPAAAGRFFSQQEDGSAAPVVVLSEPFWRQRFGGAPAALGQTLVLDGRPHTIVGVAPASYSDTWRFDAWVPIPITARAGQGNFLQVIGRLRDGLTLDRARPALGELAAEMSRAFPGDRYGFNAVLLHDVVTQGPRQALWILLGTTGLVLLIACVNVANLLLARAVARQREMAVRMALGAGRGRLLRQLTTETVILSVAGGGLGMLMAVGLLRVFTWLAPANFPRLASVRLDLTVLMFASGVAVLCGFVAGVLPALQVSRAEPNDTLRGGGSRGATAGKAHRTSRLLVMSEVALAVMLVAAAGLTIKSLQLLMRQDLGLVTSNVLTFSVSMPATGFVAPGSADAARLAQFFQSFEERVRTLPGVIGAGAISLLPIAQTGNNGRVYLRDRPLPRDEAPIAEFRVVTPGYFDAVGVRLVAGRLPDVRDGSDSQPVVVINETMAGQLWPGQPASALGQFMGTGFDDGKTFREVIGVVRDVRSRRVEAPPDAETYVPLAQFPWGTMTYTVSTAVRADALVPALRDTLAEVDPDLPMASVRTFEDVLANATRTPRLYAALTTLFGLLAATLAIVGIYSVMSYTVAQRTREMAIRSALGASHRGLLALVLREGFTLAGIGIVAGVAGALGASRLLQALLYQVSPTDPGVLVSTAAGVAAVAGLGYLIPARRASRVVPSVALRSE